VKPTRRSLSLDARRQPKTLTDVMVPTARCRGVRVLLVNPPQSYPVHLHAEFQSYLPVGLAMLAAVLRELGAQVKIIDCLAWRHWNVRGQTVVFGMSDEQLAAEVAAFAPHVVGVTNPFTTFIEDALRTTRLIKAIDPSIQVIMGGVEPSLEPGNRQLLEDNASLDVLVRGEGEVTLCDLLAHYDASSRSFFELSTVEGILFRGAAGVERTGTRPFMHDLDELPLPAYDLIDMDRMYQNGFYARHRMRAHGSRCIPIHTSRGCPYSCTFCSVHSQVGKANRRHSPAYVVRHMRHLQQTYGVTHFHFEDDNLTLHAPRARELFEAITPLGISWDTPNGLRADTITEELAELMARAGAAAVTIAVESGDQHVLDTIVQKNLDLDDVVSAAAHLSKADIPTIAFFIVGFPGESEGEVRRTLEFAKRLTLTHNTINLLFVATPLPGTPLERQCREQGYFVRPLNNETLLSAIRLNQTSLIATEAFTKADLFLWAKDVLDTPELRTLGEHIPMFVAASPRATRMMKRFVGVPEDKEMRWAKSYWQLEHNDPPPVLAQADVAAA
jgi:magnesium-protoporphyrin IX monomethyl ester (oxidative) cyclase